MVQSMMSEVPPSAPALAPPSAPPPNYYAPGPAPGPYQAPPQSGAVYYPGGPPSCYGGPVQPYYGGPPQPIMMCPPAPAPAPAASAAAAASSGQQQQQMQQQSSTSVVVVGMGGDKGNGKVLEHYYWAMALGCMVLWCCNPICGAIAFFLATMAEQTGTLVDSRRFAKFSLVASIIGAITGIIIIVTVGVVVGGGGRASSSSSSSGGQYPGGENIPVYGGGHDGRLYVRANTADMPTPPTSRWNDQWPGIPPSDRTPYMFNR